MKFRKKPVEVEAMLFEGGAENATPIIDWILSNGGTARYHDEESAKTIRVMIPEHIAIDTLEGTMQAKAGWWIIKGVQGEFYPCEPAIFKQTYAEA